MLRQKIHDLQLEIEQLRELIAQICLAPCRHDKIAMMQAGNSLTTFEDGPSVTALAPDCKQGMEELVDVCPEYDGTATAFK